MTLSNIDLINEIASGSVKVNGLQPGAIQSASIDLHLGSNFCHYKTKGAVLFVDPRKPQGRQMHTIQGAEEYVLMPHCFVLAETEEKIFISKHLVGRVDGKSSIGRCGLSIHTTAGNLDPGFQGVITLELYNMLAIGVLLTPGMPICQLVLSQLLTPTDKGYLGQYQNASSLEASKGAK